MRREWLTSNQEEYLSLQRVMEEYRIRMCELRKRIAKDCTHPKTQPYEWEHGDGYGTQTRHTGKKCVFCAAVQHHPGSYFEKWEAKYL